MIALRRFASFTAMFALLASAAGTAFAQSGPPAAPGAGPAPTPAPAPPPPAAPAPLTLEPQYYPAYPPPPPPPPGPAGYPAYAGGPAYYEPPPPHGHGHGGRKRDLLMVAYNTAVGFGDTHDFAPDFSFLGFSFDWRARVSDNFWPGVSLAWSVLYGKGQKTLEFNNTTFTGTIATNLNVFPMLATANYYFLTDRHAARPYAGLGVGAFAAEHRLDVGIWTISDTSWHFGFAPELGVALPTGRMPLVISTKFNYGFASGRWDPLMYMNFNVGVEL